MSWQGVAEAAVPAFYQVPGLGSPGRLHDVDVLRPRNRRGRDAGAAQFLQGRLVDRSQPVDHAGVDGRGHVGERPAVRALEVGDQGEAVFGESGRVLLDEATY